MPSYAQIKQQTTSNTYMLMRSRSMSAQCTHPIADVSKQRSYHKNTISNYIKGYPCIPTGSKPFPRQVHRGTLKQNTPFV